MHATTAAKVTLCILIVILLLMIRNVFAIEPPPGKGSVQCCEYNFVSTPALRIGI